MARFESGVSNYIIGTAKAINNFPVDFNGRAFIDCKHCFYYAESSRRCDLTHEKPEFPDKFVGSHCPLEMGTEENEE